MRSKIVAGNWKMNNDQAETSTLIDALKAHEIDQLSYVECPVNEMWEISLISDLIDIRDNPYTLLPGFTIDEIKDMLSYACVS